MNFKLIARYLAITLLLLAASFTICYFFELFEGGSQSNQIKHIWEFSIPCVTLLSVVLYLPSHKQPLPNIFRREALAIVGLSWIAIILIGAIPLWLALPLFSYVDAIFELTSGFTTTGISVLDFPEHLPTSILFWRQFTQFLGGAGIVVFFVIILRSVGANTKVLISNESSAQAQDFEGAQLQSELFRILLLYCCLTLACAGLFYLEGMTLFDATCHSFATIATGGFSTQSGSIGFYNSAAIEWTAIIFMILGATPFLLMLNVLDGKFYSLKKNSEFFNFLFIIAFFSIAATIAITHAPGFSSQELSLSIRQATFQITSFITTTGFSSFDYNTTPAAVHAYLMVVMLIGGCTASTAGGIKILRIVVALKTLHLHILHFFRPRIIQNIHINERLLTSDAIQAIINFIVLAFFTIFVGVTLLAISEPNLSFEGNLSSVITALSNVGAALAEVGPNHSYYPLNPESKLLLSALMLLGRLEYASILVLFFPSFWRRFR